MTTMDSRPTPTGVGRRTKRRRKDPPPSEPEPNGKPDTEGDVAFWVGGRPYIDRDRIRCPWCLSARREDGERKAGRLFSTHTCLDCGAVYGVRWRFPIGS